MKAGPAGGAVYDISVRLHPEMTLWPDDRPPALEWEKTHADGDGQAASRLTIGSHTGTHVDAPRHFVAGGDEIDDLALEALIGPARVVRVEGVDLITEQALRDARVEPGTERLLLRTDNTAERAAGEDRPFDRGYVGLSPDAAGWLVERGLRLVGVDYLSVEPFGRYDGQTHRVLLEGEVAILEGIDLRGVPGGTYFLHCLPLKMAGAEAAPARAVLTESGAP